MINENKKVFKFGKIILDPCQVFYEKKLVFAFINIRPFKQGHCLVCPTRVEKKYSNLTETEAMELWISAKKIGDNLKKYYQVNSIQYAIQDGEDAGQTVPHCHVHVIPIQNYSHSIGCDNEQRKNRTLKEMAEEADNYKKYFVY